MDGLNKGIKIGLTFSCPNNSMGLFSNGAKQNVLFLNELLLNIGYDVELIIQDKNIKNIDNLYGFDNQRNKYSLYSNILNSNYGLVIQIGFELQKDILLELKKNGVKLVSYHCGNDYVFDMENILNGTDERNPQYCNLPPGTFDQIWSIPQMTNTNKYYWQTLYKTKCIEVPFIWSPSVINRFNQDCIKSGMDDLYYKPKGDIKIAIFEPNRNVFKWSLPCLLVCENSYTIEKSIDHIFVTNVSDNETFNLKTFNNLVRPLFLHKDKKISIEARYSTLYFMSKNASVAVSHQWENGLNYLYLDLAWMGWPIVHNAHLCKDIGYYYEGFNYEMGGKVLNDVIKHHHLNYEKYIDDNRKLIDRYLPTNKELQKKYEQLVNSLLIDKKSINNTSKDIIFYVIYCNDERLEFMKKQVSDLNLPYEFVYFKSYLPETNLEWEVKGDKFSSNKLQCCFRSHISAIKDFTEKYPNKKYVCVLEDDVCLLKEGFESKLEEVLNKYSQNKEIDYVSIGYLPTNPTGYLTRERLSLVKNQDNLIYYEFDKGFTIWGTQAQIFSKETSKKIVELLDRKTGKEVYDSVNKYVSKNEIKQNKQIYLTPDSLIPLIFSQGIVNPHLAIEGKFYSSIHAKQNSDFRQENWKTYSDMGYIKMSDYYNC